jgi:hypothetical protein
MPTLAEALVDALGRILYDVEHADSVSANAINPHRIQRVKQSADIVAQEVNAIRAGADSTPVAPGVIPTPGQAWHRLLNAEPEERTERLARLLDSSNTASICYQNDHEGRIELSTALLGSLRDRCDELFREQESLKARNRELSQYLQWLEGEHERALQKLRKRTTTERLADRLWEGFQKFRERTGY